MTQLWPSHRLISNKFYASGGSRRGQLRTASTLQRANYRRRILRRIRLCWSRAVNKCCCVGRSAVATRTQSSWLIITSSRWRTFSISAIVATEKVNWWSTSQIWAGMAGTLRLTTNSLTWKTDASISVARRRTLARWTITFQGSTHRYP